MEVERNAASIGVVSRIYRAKAKRINKRKTRVPGVERRKRSDSFERLVNEIVTKGGGVPKRRKRKRRKKEAFFTRAGAETIIPLKLLVA